MIWAGLDYPGKIIRHQTFCIYTYTKYCALEFDDTDDFFFCSQVYKVLTGSPADKDGRVRKGDRILSINGKSMKGITHRESLAILKVRPN